ncbi:MAG: hypothetical protein ACJAUH_001215 [Saprospiraceae bacterium]|jgi:hypothetical protein
MEQQKKLSLTLELVFWVVTAIIALGVLRPISVNFTDFPFLWHNILIIVVFITYTRYTFLWRHTLLAKSYAFRFLILLGTIPLVFFMIQNMNVFQSYLDDYGYDAFMDLLKSPLSNDRKEGLLQYIRSEFVFFSIGAISAAIVLPVRMIISIWRTNNNKGV